MDACLSYVRANVCSVGGCFTAHKAFFGGTAKFNKNCHKYLKDC